jgi:hypothetical protein
VPAIAVGVCRVSCVSFVSCVSCRVCRVSRVVREGVLAEPGFEVLGGRECQAAHHHQLPASVQILTIHVSE